jgi:hypothetical protein
MSILKTLGAATLYIIVVFALVFLLADALDRQPPITKEHHLHNIGAMP